MDALTALLAQHGLTLVFVNVVLAQLGLPLPALPMLVVAGSLVSAGTLSVFPLAVAVIAGSLLGDTPWYLAGRRYGHRILRTLCRISIEPDSCVKQTENIFWRWGPRSLIVAKYVPGFSTLAPPLAGTMRLKFRLFLLYSAAAATLWGAGPIAAGFLFSEQVGAVLRAIEDAGIGAALVLGAIVLVYAVFKGTQRYLLIRFLRMIRISVPDLRRMIDAGEQPIILDVRSALAREADPRLIPGAVAVELAAIEEALKIIPPDRDVVVYCS